MFLGNFLKHLVFWLLLITPLFSESFNTVDENRGGTVVVSYGTGKEGSRIDRVRFWLVNELYERKLFPRNQSFVDDPEKGKRIVLIENLPPGRYHLEFLYPNSDHFFEEVPKRTLSLPPNGIVKIEQEIKEREMAFTENNPTEEENENKEIAQIFIPGRQENTIYYYPFRDAFYQEPSFLNVRSNLEEARWTIFQEGQIIYSGQGSVTDIQVPSGPGFIIRAQDFPTYELKVFPKNPINLQGGDTSTFDLIYRKILGTISVELEIPKGDGVTLFIEGNETKSPTIQHITPKDGLVHYVSPTLPLGSYTVNFRAPPYIKPIPPIQVELQANNNPTLRPVLKGAHQVNVSTNINDADYALKNEDSGKTFFGKGASFQFQELLPGNYLLTFSSNDKNAYIPPNPERFSLSRFRTQEENIHKEYELAGKLTLSSNAPSFKVHLDPLKSGQGSREEWVHNGIKTISLPEGKWRVLFLPLEGSNPKESPSIKEVTIRANSTEEIRGEYGEEAINRLSKRQEAKKELPAAQEANPINSPKFVEVEGGTFQLGDTFNDNRGNTWPPTLVEVDTFLINVFEVTNGEYAAFLNKAFKENAITIENGLIFDKEAKLLFKTLESEPTSQITFSKNQEAPFQPIPGKSSYPVIHVSWFGANFYAKENQTRLPTEAEWEKAASVTYNQDFVVKYRFGFEKNNIDRSLGNYNYSNTPFKNESSVLTTPVGFYNGLNLLPLNPNDLEQVKTTLAKSPSGAYDMSGNVWEWTADWYSENPPKEGEINPKGKAKGMYKVAKGGCYASFQDGVRVAERMPLFPEYTDQFTGFRVAKSSNQE